MSRKSGVVRAGIFFLLCLGFAAVVQYAGGGEEEERTLSDNAIRAQSSHMIRYGHELSLHVRLMREAGIPVNRISFDFFPPADSGAGENDTAIFRRYPALEKPPMPDSLCAPEGCDPRIDPALIHGLKSTVWATTGLTRRACLAINGILGRGWDNPPRDKVMPGSYDAVAVFTARELKGLSSFCYQEDEEPSRYVYVNRL